MSRQSQGSLSALVWAPSLQLPRVLLLIQCICECVGLALIPALCTSMLSTMMWQLLRRPTGFREESRTTVAIQGQCYVHCTTIYNILQYDFKSLLYFCFGKQLVFNIIKNFPFFFRSFVIIRWLEVVTLRLSLQNRVIIDWNCLAFQDYPNNLGSLSVLML